MLFRSLLISATEPFSLYPPNVTAQANREVVGIVTKCDHWAGNPEQAAEWLRLAGCKKIFMTSSFTGEGIADIISYLKEEHETLPWEEVKAQYDNLGYGEGESDKKMNLLITYLLVRYDQYLVLHPLVIIDYGKRIKATVIIPPVINGMYILIHRIPDRKSTRLNSSHIL